MFDVLTSTGGAQSKMNEIYGIEAESSEKKAFAEWQAKMHSNRNDLLFEKRKAELNRLVRRVINEELDEFDRKIIELHWYKGLSKSEIAEKMGIDRSTVHRHFTAINEIIYEKLKYAVELIYQDGRSPKKILKEKSSEALCSHINSDEISKRLKALREEKFMSVESLSEKTGISDTRIMATELRGGLLTMAELKKLTDFYKVSCNYIIFGTD